MAKRKGAQGPIKPPATKKARFSNPPPLKAVVPTPTDAPAAAAPPASNEIPRKFVVSAGSYERLLYGLECHFDPSPKSSTGFDLQVEPIFSFPAHLSSLRTVASSVTTDPSDGTTRKIGGKYLVSGGQDEVIKVWDLHRRKEVGSLEGDTAGTITCLRFCPQRNMLLSASSDSTISLYRVRDWVLLRSLKGHKGRVNSIDPHPQGRVCLSVGKDNNLRMWDLVAGKSVATLKLGQEGDVVRWNQLGTKFAVICANSLTVYGIDMSIHHSLTAPSRFHDLQFSTVGENEYLFVACEDGKVRVFDVSNPPEPVKVGQEEDETTFESRDKIRLVAELTGHTNRVKMMDVVRVGLPQTSTASTSKTEQAPQPTTTVLVSASSDGRINLYDLSILSTVSSPSKPPTKKSKKNKQPQKQAEEEDKAATAPTSALQVEPSAMFDTDKSRLTSICAIALIEKSKKNTAQPVSGTTEQDSDDDDQEDDEEEDAEDDGEMLDKFAGEESGDEDQDFEGIMINLSDNEIDEDFKQDEDEDEDEEDEEEEEFQGIGQVE
ncbi:uncharacterized protein JCM15063_003314 [Sporobolomyces koalae]|uniref:uncharacterized protein n=1 Tax=Sporobolomyces koalae TaxID=500713 RepID=UPI00317BBDD0